MSGESLESLLKRSGNIVDLLRNSQVGAYVYPVVPIEFSNWRSEQVGWQKTAVLYDQSHHMSEVTVSGPDALRLLSHLTINSFANFTPNKAKQMVPCSYDGYVIGDGILFYLDMNELLFVGRTTAGDAASVRCGTAWRGLRGSRSGVLTRRAMRSVRPSSRRDGTSVWCRSARAPTRATRSSPAGFPHRCRRCSRASG